MRMFNHFILSFLLILFFTACGGDRNFEDKQGGGNSTGTVDVSFDQLEEEYKGVINFSKPIQNLKYRCESRVFLQKEPESFTTGTTTSVGEFVCESGNTHVGFFLGNYVNEEDDTYYDIASIELGPLESIALSAITPFLFDASNQGLDDGQLNNAGRLLYVFEGEQDFIIPEAAHNEIGLEESQVSSRSAFNEESENVFNAYLERVFATATTTVTLLNSTETTTKILEITNKERAGIYAVAPDFSESDESGEFNSAGGGFIYLLRSRSNDWVGMGLMAYLDRNEESLTKVPVMTLDEIRNPIQLPSGEMSNFSLISTDNEFSVSLDGRFINSKIYKTVDQYRADYNETININESDLGKWTPPINIPVPVGRFSANKAVFTSFNIDYSTYDYPIIFTVDVIQNVSVDNDNSTEDGQVNNEKLIDTISLIAADDGNIYLDRNDRGIDCALDDADALVGIQQNSRERNGKTEELHFRLLFAGDTPLVGLTTERLPAAATKSKLRLKLKDLNVDRILEVDNDNFSDGDATWSRLNPASKVGASVESGTFVSVSDDRQKCTR